MIARYHVNMRAVIHIARSGSGQSHGRSNWLRLIRRVRQRAADKGNRGTRFADNNSGSRGCAYPNGAGAVNHHAGITRDAAGIEGKRGEGYRYYGKKEKGNDQSNIYLCKSAMGTCVVIFHYLFD